MHPRGDDWQCDHGAQYFTARDPDFRAEVARWQHGVAADPARPAGSSADPASTDAAGTFESLVGTPGDSPASLALTPDLHGKAFTVQPRRAQPGWRLSTACRPGEAFDAPSCRCRPPGRALLRWPTAPALAGSRALAQMRAAWALMLRYDAPRPPHFDAAFVNHGPALGGRTATSPAAALGRPGCPRHAPVG